MSGIVVTITHFHNVWLTSLYDCDSTEYRAFRTQREAEEYADKRRREAETNKR